MVTEQEVKDIFAGFQQQATIQVQGNTLIVKAGYIADKNVFNQLLKRMSSIGAERITAGKDSHWRVPLTTVNKPNEFKPSDPLAITQHIDDMILRLSVNIDEMESLKHEWEALKKEVEAILK